MQVFSYIFWPRPPATGYDNPKIQAVLVVCALLVVASFALRYWRRKLRNPQTKKLSKSWSSAAFSFGVVGVILAVARAEDISYISMRFWWVLWVAFLALYLFMQFRLFRAKHYEMLPKQEFSDPRDKYLPKKKK